MNTYQPKMKAYETARTSSYTAFNSSTSTTATKFGDVNAKVLNIFSGITSL